MAVSERKSATERRDEILEAALVEFAAHGLDGGSTEAIARAAGISQPYVFRLFGTKKQLFIATVERCMRGTLDMFHTASAGLKGEDALHAIGEAYVERLASDPTYLHSQMQAYAASGDPEIREVVRRGYGELVDYVERVSGVPADRVAHFFAKGMLLNVIASMDLLQAEEGWAQRLIDGCRKDV
ncbi:MAG: TetR/AcrR family transcriptional regulator [Actinobacteria bacterium]|nr:MAG: TetR/AcrR family transcriptional regulator [Actinomycetota bacterium]